MEFLNQFINSGDDTNEGYDKLITNLNLWLIRQSILNGKFKKAEDLIDKFEINVETIYPKQDYSMLIPVLIKYIPRLSNNKQENAAFYDLLRRFLSYFDVTFVDELVKIPMVDWVKIKEYLVGYQSLHPLIYLVQNNILNLTVEDATKLLGTWDIEPRDVEFLLTHYSIPYAKIVRLYNKAFYDLNNVEIVSLYDRFARIKLEDKIDILNDYPGAFNRARAPLIYYVLKQDLPNDVLKNFVSKLFKDSEFILRAYVKNYPNASKILVNTGPEMVWYNPPGDLIYTLDKDSTKSSNEKIKFLQDKLLNDLAEKYQPGGSGATETREKFEARCGLEPIEALRAKVKAKIRNASVERIDELINQFRVMYDFVAETLEDKRETLLEIVETLDRGELCKLV